MNTITDKLQGFWQVIFNCGRCQSKFFCYFFVWPVFQFTFYKNYFLSVREFINDLFYVFNQRLVIYFIFHCSRRHWAQIECLANIFLPDSSFPVSVTDLVVCYSEKKWVEWQLFFKILMRFPQLHKNWLNQTFGIGLWLKVF